MYSLQFKNQIVWGKVFDKWCIKPNDFTLWIYLNDPFICPSGHKICLFCGKTSLLTKKIISRLIHMKINTSHISGLLRLLLRVSTHRPALLNAFTTGLADPNRQKHTLNMAWKHWVCRRYFLIKKSSRREARVEAGRSGRGQREKLNKRGEKHGNEDK